MDELPMSINRENISSISVRSFNQIKMCLLFNWIRFRLAYWTERTEGTGYWQYDAKEMST